MVPSIRFIFNERFLFHFPPINIIYISVIPYNQWQVFPKKYYHSRFILYLYFWLPFYFQATLVVYLKSWLLKGFSFVNNIFAHLNRTNFIHWRRQIQLRIQYEQIAVYTLNEFYWQVTIQNWSCIQFTGKWTDCNITIGMFDRMSKKSINFYFQTLYSSLRRSLSLM